MSPVICGHYWMKKPNTGILLEGSPYVIAPGAGSTGPAVGYHIAVSPDSKNVYITGNNNTISMYNRDLTTGALTYFGYVTTGLGSPGQCQVAPSGKFVYFSNNNTQTVGVYSRNTTTGALSATFSQYTSGGVYTQSIPVITPDGTGLYIPTGSSVLQFTVDTVTGIPTYLGSFNTGVSLANLLVISSDGAFVYSIGGSVLYMMSRNSGTNILSPLSPATISASSGSAYGLVISADGKNMYSAGIQQYTRSTTTGLLTSFLPLIQTNNYSVTSLVISPDGKHVYGNSTDTEGFLEYVRDLSTGQLTPLVTASFTGQTVGTTLTVTNMLTGILRVGSILLGASVTLSQRITALGTGTGGNGTYTVSASQTIGPIAMTSANLPVPGYSNNEYLISVTPDGNSVYIVDTSGYIISSWRN